MKSISYSAFRGHLAKALDQVNEDHAPLLVTRQGGKQAVVMSLDDYESYEETAYLMASPANAERLNRAITEVEAGRAASHDLVEP
ncbi:MAG TPA: type II toxin-antitoxin system prevent-host-death family antitoxin [Oleiagrimonas sp.]|nr:type II toxin-antitoxin system prevent-host-death family antitoxin [Oleiagrimonas sp.]